MPPEAPAAPAFFPVTIAAMRAIDEDFTEGKPYALAVYVSLVALANEQGQLRVAVTHRDLARSIGASRSTVQRALRHLRDAGLLEVIERVGAGAENDYLIVNPVERVVVSDGPRIDFGDDVDGYLVSLRADRCSYCDGPSRALDHIDPRHFGGAHHLSNRTAACTSCNSSKGALTLLAFLARRRWRPMWAQATGRSEIEAAEQLDRWHDVGVRS